MLQRPDFDKSDNLLASVATEFDLIAALLALASVGFFYSAFEVGRGSSDAIFLFYLQSEWLFACGVISAALALYFRLRGVSTEVCENWRSIGHSVGGEWSDGGSDGGGD